MVNIVLVSHSKKLADGVAEMVKQMTASEAVKILTAAGIGDDNQELGTNAMEIMEAIEAVYTADGVLVLMDLGSAILSTEMALDLLSDEMKANIRICPAPFVEGAIAAAVQAGLGASLQEVNKEAMQALSMKTEQLEDALGDLPEEEPVIEEKEVKDDHKREVTLVIPNETGLHARPAVLFVQTIGSHDAKVMVKNLTENNGPVNGKSIIKVLTLAARKGHKLHISAEGEQKNEVVDALIDLFERNFDE